MKSLKQPCVEATPNPGTVAREVFPPRHPLRETLEWPEYRELQERYQKLSQVKSRSTCPYSHRHFETNVYV